MKISLSLAKILQTQLADYLPVDSPHPDDIFNALGCKTISSRTQWQIAVDLIYRLLISDLLELWPEDMLGKFDDVDFRVKTLNFCKVLAQMDPSGSEAFESYGDEYGLPWVGFDLCMTDTTRCLLAKHGLIWSENSATPFSSNFIEDIEVLFEAHGAAWSEVPLIPIRKNF